MGFGCLWPFMDPSWGLEDLRRPLFCLTEMTSAVKNKGPAQQTSPTTLLAQGANSVFENVPFPG